MGARGIARVQALGGWRTYGEEAMAIYQDAVAKK